MARILRAVLSTGFLGSAYRSVSPAAGALSCAFWLQRISLLRWFFFPAAQPHLRLRCPEMPTRRDTRIEATRRRRLSPHQTFEDQSPVRGYVCTPAPGGRDLHPHGNCVTKPWALRSTRGHQSSFDQRIARNIKRHFTAGASGAQPPENTPGALRRWRRLQGSAAARRSALQLGAARLCWFWTCHAG